MDVDATPKSNGRPAGGRAIEQERKHDTTSQPTTVAAGTKPRWRRQRSKPTSEAASILFSWWRAMERRVLGGERRRSDFFLPRPRTTDGERVKDGLVAKYGAGRRTTCGNGVSMRGFVCVKFGRGRISQVLKD
jgi:hypothetical protein